MSPRKSSANSPRKAAASLSNQATFSNQTKLIILGVIALLVLLLLYQVRHILGPFIWAAVFAYVFNPVVSWLQDRTRLSRIWVVTGLYLLFVTVTALMIVYFFPAIARQIADLRAAIPQMIQSLNQYLATQEYIDVFGFKVDPEFVSQQIANVENAFRDYLTISALPFALGFFELILKVVVFAVTTFYLLLHQDRLSRFFRGLIPPKHHEEILDVARQINTVLGAYVRGQLLLIIIMSTATSIGLTILQVRYSLLLGILTGVLEIFPIIGPITAGAIACSVALFGPAPWGLHPMVYTLIIAAMYTVFRNIEDYLVIPNLIGRLVELHPVVVIFSLLSGGVIAGFLGIFLAVPVAATIKILGGYIHRKLLEPSTEVGTASS